MQTSLHSNLFLKSLKARLCLFGFLTSSSSTMLYRGPTLRLTSETFTCCHTETECGDPDFCFSQSHYKEPTTMDGAPGVEIKPMTS